MPAVVILALSGIVFAVGECLHAVVVQPLIAELAPPALVGRYMALFGITFSVGLAAGPSASASALAVSPELPWIAGAAAMLALLPLLSPVVHRAQVRSARSRVRDGVMTSAWRAFHRSLTGTRPAAGSPPSCRHSTGRSCSRCRAAAFRSRLPSPARSARPLDVFVVRKLGVPAQPELAMGAVASGGVRVLNEDVLRDASRLDGGARRGDGAGARRGRVSRAASTAATVRRRSSLGAMSSSSTTVSRPAPRCGPRWPPSVRSDRRASSSRCLSRRPRRSPRSLATGSSSHACTRRDDFVSVGSWYRDFGQVTDEEVIRLIS